MPFPSVDAAPAPPGKAAPTAGQERIAALDITRGIALFGILLMNIMFMSGPEATFFNPAYSLGDPTVNFVLWFGMFTFFEGTMRTLFSLLFGAGAMLLLLRLEARESGLGAADVYYRRTIGLILFGMLNAYVFLWVGDILFLYGVVGLFLFLFRKVPVRWLFVAAAAVLVVLIVVRVAGYHDTLDQQAAVGEAEALQAQGIELSEEQEEALTAWKDRLGWIAPTPEQIEEEVAEAQKGYIANFQRLRPMVVGYHTKFFYDWWFWDAFAVMLIGMALFRLGVLTLKAPVRVYWWMAGIGYAIGLPVRLWVATHVVQADFSIAAFDRASILYDVGRLGMAAGHLGLILLFCCSGALAWLQRALAAVGRMALTNYLLQSIIAAFVFFGFGLGLFSRLERIEIYLVVLAVWAFEIALSLIWLRHFRFGPFEWLWRSFTYLRWQPMRRDRLPPEAEQAANPQ